MRKQKVYQEFVYLMPGGNLNTTISIHSVAERNMKKKIIQVRLKNVVHL